MGDATQVRKLVICKTWNEKSPHLYYRNGKFEALLVSFSEAKSKTDKSLLYTTILE